MSNPGERSPDPGRAMSTPRSNQADGQRRYLDVEMPEWFVLEFQRLDGAWMDDGH